jgi:hypothetical protein
VATRKAVRHNGVRDTHELAWAAGFFDGEGNAGLSGRQLRLRVSQVGRSTLDRFQAALGGMGQIRPDGERPRKQPQHIFELLRIEEVHLATWLLWPWLSEPKRAQIERAMAQYHETRKAVSSHS